MNWEEVSIDDDALLKRTADILRGGDTRGNLLPIRESIAADRSAIGSGTVRLFYYQDAGFELVAKMTYQPKRSRYLVCYGVAGNVSASAALDLIIDKTHDLMQSLGLVDVYGMQPKKLGSQLLQQIYQLAATDPRVQETLLADMPDMWAYRLAYHPAPP